LLLSLKTRPGINPLLVPENLTTRQCPTTTGKIGIVIPATKRSGLSPDFPSDRITPRLCKHLNGFLDALETSSPDLTMSCAEAVREQRRLERIMAKRAPSLFRPSNIGTGALATPKEDPTEKLETAGSQQSPDSQADVAQALRLLRSKEEKVESQQAKTEEARLQGYISGAKKARLGQNRHGLPSHTTSTTKQQVAMSPKSAQDITPPEKERAKEKWERRAAELQEKVERMHLCRKDGTLNFSAKRASGDPLGGDALSFVVSEFRHLVQRAEEESLQYGIDLAWTIAEKMKEIKEAAAKLATSLSWPSLATDANALAVSTAQFLKLWKALLSFPHCYILAHNLSCPLLGRMGEALLPPKLRQLAC